MDSIRDEQELIRRILDGNIDQFSHIIDQYERLVGHIVHRMVSNSADREEITQDIFIRVYTNLKKFRHDAKLSTWIAKIAYNRCINHLRQSKLEPDPMREATDPPAISREVSSGWSENPPERPDQLVEQDEVQALLQKQIARLPEIYRTIITLYHLEEMKYSEIAEVMDIPVGTVKSYLFRARRTLRDALDKINLKELSS